MMSPNLPSGLLEQDICGVPTQQKTATCLSPYRDEYPPATASEKSLVRACSISEQFPYHFCLSGILSQTLQGQRKLALLLLARDCAVDGCVRSMPLPTSKPGPPLVRIMKRPLVRELNFSRSVAVINAGRCKPASGQQGRVEKHATETWNVPVACKPANRRRSNPGKRNKMPFPPAELPGIDALRLAGFSRRRRHRRCHLPVPSWSGAGSVAKALMFGACSRFDDGF